MDEAAEELGSQALCRAITQAGIDPSSIGALFFVSISGISSPSMDARLIKTESLAVHQTDSDLWVGMRGGSGGNRAGDGLCEGVSR